MQYHHSLVVYRPDVPTSGRWADHELIPADCDPAVLVMATDTANPKLVTPMRLHKPPSPPTQRQQMETTRDTTSRPAGGITMTLLRNQPPTQRDELIDRINRGENIVMPLRAFNQLDHERVACFTMSSITLDGHDYHVHEDSQERSFSVVDAHDLHKLGEAHISPCGEYWLVQLDDDAAAPFGSGWSVHTNSTTQEEVARSIVAAVTF